VEDIGVDRMVILYRIVSGIHVIQDTDLWQDVVNTVMNNRFLHDAENFLTF
jgi:hypothetical protein